MNKYHVSVLLQETIDFLSVKPGKKYIDGTLGGGGHTLEILKRGGQVLGIDMDQDALDEVSQKCKTESECEVGENLFLVKGNFRDIDDLAISNGFEKVSGILFDLGVSSHQVDSAERGFSFMRDGPLDMRMDQNLKIKANDLINILTKGELYDLFTRLGEERFAKTIVFSIIRARRIKPITTTTELSDIVRRAVPMQGKINPSTRIFQALRIAVNDELNSIREALPKALDLLAPGGRIAVISFHSLEDRIIKVQFKEWTELGYGKSMTKKPVIPSDAEIQVNSRSRSSKLRIFEKAKV